MKNKIKPKFVQASCVEGDKVDPRQANLIKRHEPDIILFEKDAKNNNPDTIFNKYPPNRKPLKEVDKIIEKLKLSAKEYPYALSDIGVWENIIELWKKGKNTLTYNIDSSKSIRKHFYQFDEYPRCRKDPTFWAYLYIREHDMTKHIEHILSNYKEKQAPVIAVFLQLIHWKHVQFLMKKPTPTEIWEYYFGRFPKLTREELDDMMKEKSKSLYREYKKRDPFQVKKGARS